MLTIAWDVDDVLNNLMQLWLEKKWLAENPDCKTRLDDLKINPPHEILGISKDEYLESLDVYRKTEAYDYMLPDPDVLKWFELYGHRARHVVVTAVALNCADLSAGWVMKHFGKWIRSFNLVPTPRTGQALPEYFKTKQDCLEWLGEVDVFVEDSENNLVGIEKMGITPLLVGRPWNSGIKNIQEILSELTDKIEREGND